MFLWDSGQDLVCYESCLLTRAVPMKDIQLRFESNKLLSLLNNSIFPRRLRSPNNPPLASADMLLINPPTLLKSSSSVGGSDTPLQKKHNSVDNLRLQGTHTVKYWCMLRPRRVKAKRRCIWRECGLYGIAVQQQLLLGHCDLFFRLA